jgi:site-specific DNA-methyltransferase (adenine-specific)
MKLNIMQGDCLEMMKLIPNASVDLILADLPYGMTACAWDSVIPFAPLWAEYERIAKPAAAIVLTASQPFTSALIMSNPRLFKYCWTWEKEGGTNFFNAKHQPLKVHEDIAVFSRGAASHSKNLVMNYNPQMADGEPYKNKTSKGKGLMKFHQKMQERNSSNGGTRYPRSVMKFTTDRGLHPTQKPLALMEYLIKTYTNPGDTVLDNVMGSGTTGVACMNLARLFIGIEKDAAYFEIAAARIRAAVPHGANDNEIISNADANAA